MRRMPFGDRDGTTIVPSCANIDAYHRGKYRRTLCRSVFSSQRTQPAVSLRGTRRQADGFHAGLCQETSDRVGVWFGNPRPDSVTDLAERQGIVFRNRTRCELVSRWTIGGHAGIGRADRIGRHRSARPSSIGCGNHQLFWLPLHTRSHIRRANLIRPDRARSWLCAVSLEYASTCPRNGIRTHVHHREVLANDAA